MFYLIGLGLNEKSLGIEAIEICKKADAVYLENYTVKIPYNVSNIEDVIGKKIVQLDRDHVEEADFLDNAKNKDVVLLVYGNALTATTHVSLLAECVEKNIEYKVMPNASIFDAVAETGLQLYKFGKVTSIPFWKENYKPDSFAKVIKDNLSIDAHTLVLVDIGLKFEDSLNQLKKALKKTNLEIDYLYICSKLGTDDKKIFAVNLKDKINLIKNAKDVEEPFCFVIPAKMHFVEKEFMENYKG